MRRVLLFVVLAMFVAALTGCAAYDKAKDLNIEARTEPQDFTLDDINAGFDKKEVSSEDWEDNADNIKEVRNVEISYTYTNPTDAAVEVDVYISRQNLEQAEVAAEATLLHQAVFNPGTHDVSRDDATIENRAAVLNLLEDSDGKFYIYTVTSAQDGVNITIENFRVYSELNVDILE